jgi:hypothetical protein
MTPITFSNAKTGNKVTTSNKETIALMRDSDNYKEIKSSGAKLNKG